MVECSTRNRRVAGSSLTGAQKTVFLSVQGRLALIEHCILCTESQKFIYFQMCCDANFKFTSCNASWPGSVHDSRIFRTSALCLQFENGMYLSLVKCRRNQNMNYISFLAVSWSAVLSRRIYALLSTGSTQSDR